MDEARRVADILREETVGGALLLAGAVAAMIWANSPWSGAYEALRAVRVGPSALHLDLNLAAWASDGLLAIFFFVAGWSSNASSSPVTCARCGGPRCRSRPRSAACSSRPCCT
ncbi:hypothetical protein GCM10018952_68230 [Streptosporangium vulgare]